MLPKRVAIDLRMIHLSGLGTYIMNLVPGVIHHCPDVYFILLADPNKVAPYSWAHQDNVEVVACEVPIFSIAEQRMFTKIMDVDLYWTPQYNIPWFPKSKLLVTIHDVFPLSMPHLMGGWYRYWYAKLLLRICGWRAEKIISISNFTTQELIQLNKTKPQKIETIHNGVNPEWFSVVKQQMPHDKPYILYVGNVRPNKNPSRLLQAFYSIADDIEHDLIIVGKKEGFRGGDVDINELLGSHSDGQLTGQTSAVANSRQNNAQRVLFTGHVTKQQLQQYFAHAEVFVFPSLYEGFGAPPLEAMACGCPVVASNAASLPEICGDAAVYCNPYSVEDIADKIKQLIKDHDLQQEMIAKGKKRIQQFCLDSTVKKTTKVIRRMLRL